MHERANVGDQDQTAGVLVETARTRDGWISHQPAIREQLINGRAFAIRVRANVADGLVQNGEQAVDGFERLAIQRDLMRIDTLIGACGTTPPTETWPAFTTSRASWREQ